MIASHRRRRDLIDDYTRVMLDRAVDGIVAIDTPCRSALDIPVVSVSGHLRTAGVTNITLDHGRAARLALTHLRQLGHRQIAVLRGGAGTSDAAVRWAAIRDTAGRLGVALPRALSPVLDGDASAPDAGRQTVSALIARGRFFTAVLAFNDATAIGAMAALRAPGLSVPADVSVMGVDDVRSAAYLNPGLTTVRQPLREMGALAATTVVERIGRRGAGRERSIVVRPELVIRERTGPARSSRAR